MAGCGTDDDEAIRAAVDDYVAAIQEGDAPAACDQLSEDELAELDQSGSCEEVFEAGFELFSAEGVEIPDYEVAEIEVDGETASATVESGSTDETMPLIREDGNWKLDGATSFGDFHPDDPIP
jgi:ketosteroid isomerase-like protein